MSQTPAHIRQRNHRARLKERGIEPLSVYVPRQSRDLVKRIAAELTARHLAEIEEKESGRRP